MKQDQKKSSQAVFKLVELDNDVLYDHNNYTLACKNALVLLYVAVILIYQTTRNGPKRPSQRQFRQEIRESAYANPEMTFINHFSNVKHTLYGHMPKNYTEFLGINRSNERKSFHFLFSQFCKDPLDMTHNTHFIESSVRIRIFKRYMYVHVCIKIVTIIIHC